MLEVSTSLFCINGFDSLTPVCGQVVWLEKLDHIYTVSELCHHEAWPAHLFLLLQIR